MNIGAGAALSGAGVIGGSLTLGGTIFVPAPGTVAASFNARRLGVEATQAIAVPSLVINGNLNATPGSVFDFTVTPDGAAPIVVNGLATLTDTHVHVGSTLTNLPRYSTYLGMTSSGMTVNGADATTALNGIVPVLKFDDTSMYVTLLNENIPLSTLATAPNNGPVAAALDRVKKSATGDLAFVISELTALPDAQLNDALHQLSGELHATKVRLAVDDGLASADSRPRRDIGARRVRRGGPAPHRQGVHPVVVRLHGGARDVLARRRRPRGGEQRRRSRRLRLQSVLAADLWRGRFVQPRRHVHARPRRLEQHDGAARVRIRRTPLRAVRHPRRRQHRRQLCTTRSGRSPSTQPCRRSTASSR